MRLLALAASFAFVSGRIGEHASDDPSVFAARGRPQEDGDRFHNRDHHVPDVSDQAFETTVKCTRERDKLASELDRLLAERRQLDGKCEADLQYYREMTSMAQQQIARLTAMVAERLDESDLPPLYKAQYKAIMCTKLYDGFVMDVKSSRREVSEICEGRRNLTDCKFQRYESATYEAMHTGVEGNSTGYYKQLSKLQTKFLRLSSSVDNVQGASPECFQAKAVQDQVDSTRRSSKLKKEYCAKEVAKMKVNLEKMQKKEDDLWTKYNSHISQRDTIKKQAAQKVTVEFCAAVQASRKRKGDCNHSQKDFIKAFHGEKCLQGVDLEYTQ